MTAKAGTEPMHGEELTNFLKGVLRGIGAPPTPWNLCWMEQWAASEGTLAGYNPLATERPEPGHDSLFNHQGVRNYDSEDTGVAATVATLGLSYYAPIVESLRAQRFTNRKAILKAYQTWAGVTAPEAYHVAALIKGGWTPTGAKTLQAEEVAGVRAPVAPAVAAHARKTARDVVAAAPFGVLALVDAATSTNWSVLDADVNAGHWGVAVAAFLATPFALACWRALRAWLAARPA